MEIKAGFLKKISLVLSILLLAILTSGCSIRSTGTTESKVITIWGFEDEDTWKPTIDELSQGSLNGYEINYVKKTLDANYENDSLNSIMSGQGPDVWAMPADWVYRHKDKLAPMPDDMLKDIDLDNKFVPAIKQSLDFDGKLYGLSPVVNTLMLYINKSVTAQVLSEFNQSDAATNAEQADKVNTLLNSTPQTWTEFADFANLVTKKNGDQIVRSGVALGTSQNVTISEDPLYAMMLQNGTAMTSNDLQTATFNLPSSGGSDIPGKRALDFLASFSKPGSANYSWNGSMPKDIEAFATGKTAMVFAYESFANYMDQNYPNVEYSQSALPQIGGADEKIVDFARFNALVVPGLTKFPQEAWEVVSAVSTEHATDFSSALKITTSQKDNAMIKVLKDRAGNSDVGSFQAQTAVTWNKGRYPLNIDSIFTTMINNVSSSGQDTKAALDTAASQVTQILRKTTW